MCDESIRWLWGKGRQKEALEIASKAIEVNGKYFVKHPDPNVINEVNIEKPKIDTRQVSESSEGTVDSEEPLSEPRSGLIDLFRLPNLRFRALNMSYNWFANSLVYYGLAFNIGTLPGNPYLMSFLNGLAEIPGYIIVIFLLDRMGRRSLGSLMLFIGGFACIVIAFIPHGEFMLCMLYGNL